MSSRVLKKGARPLPAVEWRPVSGAAAMPEPDLGMAFGSAMPPAGAAPEIVRLEKEAFHNGLREGEAAGTRKSMEKLQEAIQGFAQAASQLTSYKATLRAEVEREIVALALTVARKILRRELSLDPNLVLAVVKSCLEEIQNAEIYRLRLNPQDVQAVGNYFSQQQRPRVDLVPDISITRGGVVFETAKGELDARIETQLAEIERGLADT